MFSVVPKKFFSESIHGYVSSQHEMTKENEIQEVQLIMLLVRDQPVEIQWVHSGQ